MATIRPSPIRTARHLAAGFAGMLVAAIGLAGPDPIETAPLDWLAGASAQFRTSRALVAGRAMLFDEADDPAFLPALSADLQRLYADLYSRDVWRAPFDEREPLRIYVARRPVEGMRPASGRWLEAGHLSGPALLVNGDGVPAPEIVREVARQIVRETLSSYGGHEDPFLTPALVEALSRAYATDSAEDDAIWTLAAAPMLDFRAHPSTLGRLWVEELIRDRGDTALLRQAWERAAATGESALTLTIRLLAEASGPREETLLARCAARLYASLEPEPGPSRLRRFDLEAGSLDAAAPRALSASHRAFLPESAEEAIRVAWPEDGGSGAAVVRYREAALPPDVVFFEPGDVRRIPLSGVARVDWIVAGSPRGGLGIRAPAVCDGSGASAFTGLEARAAAPDRPRLMWHTASHDGMWGWAVFREELRPDGRIARTGPEIVPSSERSEDSSGYVYVDSGASPGSFYRYTVWAVTDEGLLARAFAVTLRAGESDRLSPGAEAFVPRRSGADSDGLGRAVP